MTIRSRDTIVAVLLLLAWRDSARAEVRRALVVGIDTYVQSSDRPGYQLSARTRERLKSIHGTPSRRKLDHLVGAFNDARAIRSLLIERFGFEDSNIILLPNPNQEATADNILGLLQSHLIDEAKPGDVSLFYYAGHGSRIRNTSARNDNPTGLDSTLVPADALLGVPDIRGKELARIYAQAPAKGVLLTVIEDSCYSGAASRGISPFRRRSQPPDTDVSVDESLEGQLPEDSGVLIISASQDYEPALELEVTDFHEPHGAFTCALLHVLGASPANESVERIFQRTRALMQSSVDQEPVLLARKGRNLLGLFGQPADQRRVATVAVARVRGPLIRLNGGLATNLHEGCELKRVAPAQPPLEITVTKVNGLASSDAVVSAGTAGQDTVRAGDLFELDKWTSPDHDPMRVYIGKDAPRAYPNLDVFEALRDRAGMTWVVDPTTQAPTHILSWDAGESMWSLRQNTAGAQPVWIKRLTVDAVMRLLPDATKPRLFVLIPPAPGLATALQPVSGAYKQNFTIVDSRGQADYVLMGRLCESRKPQCVEYAWALPDAPGGEKTARPLRTDWVSSSEDVPAAAAVLRDAALGLARVLGWLQLQSPEPDDSWPYQLALQNTATKQILALSEVTGGERYKLMLRREARETRGAVPARRVYVFAVDSFGKATLLFGNNLENEFPRSDLGSADAPESIALTASDWDLHISEPYGEDNYFLLASATPIDNPESIFNFDGVRSRGGPSAISPLARLLENAASGTRGAVGGIPVTWSIQRLMLISRPPDPEK